MKKGARRDILIATLGFAFGSVIIGISAVIPAHDDGVATKGSARSA